MPLKALDEPSSRFRVFRMHSDSTTVIRAAWLQSMRRVLLFWASGRRHRNWQEFGLNVSIAGDSPGMPIQGCPNLRCAVSGHNWGMASLDSQIDDLILSVVPTSWVKIAFVIGKVDMGFRKDLRREIELI
jgi:hypothetical protein